MGQLSELSSDGLLTLPVGQPVGRFYISPSYPLQYTRAADFSEVFLEHLMTFCWMAAQKVGLGSVQMRNGGCGFEGEV